MVPAAGAAVTPSLAVAARRKKVRVYGSGTNPLGNGLGPCACWCECFGSTPREAIVAPVEGDGRTFGEMEPAAKHAISHRADALRKLLAALGR